jgi:DNA (cytosine-5)-methyltransferase 1
VSKLRVLSLFAGIGGFDLGLERTGGFKTVAFCEIKPRSQRVLAKHWPGVPCWPDVTTYEFKEGEADVVVGGFPCQDISDQGLRAGIAGARSGLWSEMVRAFRVVRPRFGIVENVAALLERGMGRVLGDMATLGHDAEWHCIPAGYIGAPHERDRLWIATNAASEPGLHEPNVGETAERLRHDLDTWRARPWDEARSRVCRVEDGLPDRVDRTEQLGLAVVPQIPELIGHAILLAIADTHAQRGDGTKIAAPFMSSGGAVRQSPNPNPSGA